MESDPSDVAEQIGAVALPRRDHPLHLNVISSVDDGKFMDKRSELKDTAVGKLLIVVHHCLLASECGRHIIALGNGPRQEQGAADVIHAVVGVKSPYTLAKRANSLLSFLRWVANQGIDDVNPFTEDVVWRYMVSLRDSCAAPTKGDSMLSAIRFARHVLGFESLDSACNSKRFAVHTQC